MGATLKEIADKAFDYVVIGGGPAGLTVAARLTEDPSISVAVLEAGSANIDDPMITIPAQFGKQLGDPKYDWCLRTVPQKNANNQTYPWARGKTLGGSSAINFFVWGKPPTQDIDAWEKLGNPGWNWKRFSEYMKKAETFTPPKDEKALEYRQVFNRQAHGYSGPLQTSFPAHVTACEVPFQETLLNAGIKTAKDPLNGDPIGTCMSACTLDAKTHTRSYATTAFYTPNKDRPNFHVLCDALVHRVITNLKASGPISKSHVEATGVEFEFAGKVYVVHANKEVILSAGALKSPQILELSGIGDNRILRTLDITTKLHLPGVGANLQEHMFCSVVFELDPEQGIESLDRLADKDYAAAQLALHAQGKGVYRTALAGFTFVPLSSVTSTPDAAKELITGLRRRIEAKLKSGSLSPGLKEQYRIQLTEFEAGNGGDCEIICFPQFLSAGVPEAGKAYLTIIAAMNHPFSRGTIHVKSNNPHDQPDIDPHYFEEKFDLEVFTETTKFIRRLAFVEPFKSLIAKEYMPGPECKTDDDLKNFIKDSMATTFHTAGTLSMLPHAHNGVVDPNLLVYGTKNIRVVDLSIIPLHIAAHTQSSAYAIGEIAADILKSGSPRSPTSSGNGTSPLLKNRL